MTEEEADFVAVTVATSRASEMWRGWVLLPFLPRRRCQRGRMVKVVRFIGGFQEGESDKSSLHLKPSSVFPERTTGGPAGLGEMTVWKPLAWWGSLQSIITKETWLIKQMGKQTSLTEASSYTRGYQLYCSTEH